MPKFTQIMHIALPFRLDNAYVVRNNLRMSLSFISSFKFP